MDIEAIERAASLVYRTMPPTPQYTWPQLSKVAGTTVWVKHENHTPTGSFKVRGAISFMDWLKQAHPDVRGIVTATRGNHGQGQALAATKAGLSAKIYVPFGNSLEKNDAMASFGADLVEFGEDFDSAKLEAHRVAEADGLFFVPPFHPALVAGVSTYAMELFRNAPPIDVLYVPIGCGSGICGIIAARDALDLKTEVVGVVATGADYAKKSFDAGRPLESERADTFADGIAVRAPIAEAFDIYSKGAARVVSVSDDEIAEAMRIIFRTTHNVAEGAGAAPFAALLAERDRLRGKTAAFILCGGNVDTAVFTQVLRGETPKAAR
ncbi:MAG: threonine dehydratase [Pseudomonadota bacterium]